MEKLTLAKFSEIQGKVISFDWDDTGYVHGRHILPRYNSDFGTRITEDQFYVNDLDLWRVPDRETQLDRMNAYLRTEEYMAVGPLPGFSWLVTKLAEKNELHINTRRPDFMREPTAEVIDRHLPGVFTTIQHAPGNKLEVCRRIGATVHIDDLGSHVSDVAAGGVTGVHFGNYAWGQQGLILGPNVEQIPSWEEGMPHAA